MKLTIAGVVVAALAGVAAVGASKRGTWSRACAMCCATKSKSRSARVAWVTGCASTNAVLSKNDGCDPAPVIRSSFLLQLRRACSVRAAYAVSYTMLRRIAAA